jgi:DNA-binding SARP family transcriptional activator
MPSDIKINVLGPQQIVIDGQEQPPLAPQQRRVLAILASRPGEVITRDHLMQMLWGSATQKLLKGLQAYVSNIRSILGTSTVELIGTGYRLNLDPQAVDEVRFLGHVATGHQELSAERYYNAAQAFDAALALWRGQPYDDMENGEFTARRAGLDEALLGAQEGSLRASLEMVRSSQHAGALVARTAQAYAEHPRRERRAIDHIRCLMMSGRVPEAMQAANDFRSRINTEIGIDPGPEFMEIHAHIGRRDSHVLSAAWGSNEALPTFTTPLIHRDLERELAATLLSDDGYSLLTLVGPSGVGKTRLAGAIAEQLMPGLPGGVIWLERSDTQDSDQFLAALAQRLGIKGSGPDLKQRLSKALGDRRTLIVADDAQVRAITPAIAVLLAVGPKLAMLITSTRAVGLASEHVVELQPFATHPAPGGSAAARFVIGLVEGVGGRPATDLETLQQQLKSSSGLPVDLEQAAIAELSARAS